MWYVVFDTFDDTYELVAVVATRAEAREIVSKYRRENDAAPGEVKIFKLVQVR